MSTNPFLIFLVFLAIASVGLILNKFFLNRSKRMRQIANEFNLSFTLGQPKLQNPNKEKILNIGDDLKSNIMSGEVNGHRVLIYDEIKYIEPNLGSMNKIVEVWENYSATFIGIDEDKRYLSLRMKSYKVPGAFNGFPPPSLLREVLTSLRNDGQFDLASLNNQDALSGTLVLTNTLEEQNKAVL